MYKLCPPNVNGNQDQVKRLIDYTYVPFIITNTDYIRFKQDIMNEYVQLQDVDGNILSVEASRAYVSTLP